MVIKDSMDKIDAVMNEITKKRHACVEFSDTDLILYVDEVKVFVATILSKTIKVEMLPDVFTYSNFPHDNLAGQIHFNGKDNLSVYFGMSDCDVGDILEMIKDSVIELNLYGYIVTD